MSKSSAERAFATEPALPLGQNRLPKVAQRELFCAPPGWGMVRSGSRLP